MQEFQVVRLSHVERIRKITSKWLVDPAAEATTSMSEIAAVLLEPEPITVSMFSPGLDEVLDRLQRTEAGERAADVEVQRLEAELECWKRGERAQVKIVQHLQSEAMQMRAEIERLLIVSQDTQATAAARDVLVERRRQMVGENWTPEHDDHHANGDLAKAAACYAMAASNGVNGFEAKRPPLNSWPWHRDVWKVCDARRNLVKAGALIIAELERIDRAEDRAEAHMDVVGQNGNDGAVYAELAALAIQQGGKPIDELPDGLTWEQSPEWADRLSVAGPMSSLVWHSDDRYRYVFNGTEHPVSKDGVCGSNGTYSLGEFTLIASRQSRDATQA